MDSGRERMMKPIAPLMIEHRLIERMIRLVDRERQRVAAQGRPDPAFIDTAVDFIRTYADRCHHGKEEDIYFKDLTAREVSEEHRRLVNELIEEHKYARGVVAALVTAKERYVADDSSAYAKWRSFIWGPAWARGGSIAADIEQRLRELVEFYPGHIQKEDRQLFIPSMAYYTTEEQAAMLEQMWEFDRKLIHEKYRGVVEGLEGR